MVNPRKNLGGNRRGRKKIKYGKHQTYYLSNEIIAKLARLANGKKSAYLESLIGKAWEIAEGKSNVEKEADRILREAKGGLS